MIQIGFNTLDDKYPIFKLGRYKIICLLDTGANIPVWNGSVKAFLSKFKECSPIKTEYYASIGGFGRGAENMSVYKINNFELTDGKSRLIFKELYIAVEENRTRNFDLLLTYSMFKMINIVIRPKKTNREIVFVTSKQYVFDTYVDIKDGILKYTESYLQNCIDEDTGINFTDEDLRANSINTRIKTELVENQSLFE